MKLILKWFILAVAILLTAYIMPSVAITGFWAAFWLAFFIGLVNVTLKPLLVLLTLPINILTLGLFTLVINACLILLAESVVKGFFVEGFISALLFSLLLSFVSYLLNVFVGLKK